MGSRTRDPYVQWRDAMNSVQVPVYTCTVTGTPGNLIPCTWTPGLSIDLPQTSGPRVGRSFYPHSGLSSRSFCAPYVTVRGW